MCVHVCVRACVPGADWVMQHVHVYMCVPVLFSYNNYYNPYTPALHNIKAIMAGAFQGARTRA